MDQVKLRGEPRSDFGSRSARRMRRDGRVPAMVYGRGLDAVTISVDRRELYSVLHTESGANALIDLSVEGQKKLLTVAREVQRDPVRGEIIHLDFISISLDDPIAAEVHVEYLGVPEGTKEGGVLETIRTAVNLTALPMDIPSSIPLDISAMVVGDTLKVADLPAIEGVEYTEDPDASLVTVVIPRLFEEPEIEGELEEGEILLGEDGEPVLDEDGEPIQVEDGEGDAGDGDGGADGDEDQS
jgi:large subunit ribosomal protein L25